MLRGDEVDHALPQLAGPLLLRRRPRSVPSRLRARGGAIQDGGVTGPAKGTPATRAAICHIHNRAGGGNTSRVDFPVFHLDGLGNRLLVGGVAVLHVLINHGLAVGAIPLITALEWRGHRSRDARWDGLAYRFLFVCFIATTTVGAITGVGIWFTTSLVNPAAIGSLLRVFFWAWFAEWLVFITEVGLLLAYFLLWTSWQGERKGRHIALGVALSLFSWITMAIIVAILGFMMSTGDWTRKPGLLVGFLNPLYLPQLAFRTPLALMTAGLVGMFLTLWLTDKGEFRARAIRTLSVWTLVWLPLTYLGSRYYWRAVPEAMIGNLPVAVTTAAFTEWHQALVRTAGACVAVIALAAVWGVLKPQRMPRVALVLPIALALLLLGYFERVREFIRKPYVIANYMYANGLRVEDYPLLQRDGLLAHSTYVSTRAITSDNVHEAGRDVFLVACSRCHTVSGVNSVVAKLEQMYGTGAWSRDALATYVRSMHGARTFMPAFPGTPAELDALAAYLVGLQTHPERLEGVQVTGLRLPRQGGGTPSESALDSATPAGGH